MKIATDVAQLFERASKYKTRTEFFRSENSAYHALKRIGMLDDACAHMSISDKYSYKRWTKEEIFAEAAKYKNRAEFKRLNSGAYCFALRNGMLSQLFAMSRDGHRFWHIFELMAVAIKYSDKSEFIKKERQAYNFANKNKLTDIACAHMNSARVNWNKDLVIAEATKYQSRGMFQAMAAGAYKHADKYGYMDEACSHMPPPEYGFSKCKPATLYHLELCMPGGFSLYKIGITNRDVEKRIAGMRVRSDVTVLVLDKVSFSSGRDARMTEKRLARQFAEFRYLGEPIMNNGNTELYTVPLIDTKNA